MKWMEICSKQLLCGKNKKETKIAVLTSMAIFEFLEFIFMLFQGCVKIEGEVLCLIMSEFGERGEIKRGFV